MTEFLIKNSFSLLGLVFLITFWLIYIWIKTHKTRYIVTSFSILFICFSFLVHYIYTNDVLLTKVVSNEKKKKDMINELTAIMNSKENEIFPVFREVINLTLKDNFTINDYKMLISFNKNVNFKQSLQMDKQQIDDLNTLMQLTNTKSDK